MTVSVPAGDPPFAGGPPVTLIVIYVSDLDVCQAFYEAFGLVFVREKHGEGPEHISTRVANGCLLELYPAGSRPPTWPFRFGLAVPAAVFAHHLSREGVFVSAAAVIAGYLSGAGELALRDPDGRVVVLSPITIRPAA